MSKAYISAYHATYYILLRPAGESKAMPGSTIHVVPYALNGRKALRADGKEIKNESSYPHPEICSLCLVSHVEE